MQFLENPFETIPELDGFHHVVGLCPTVRPSIPHLPHPVSCLPSLLFLQCIETLSVFTVHGSNFATAAGIGIGDGVIAVAEHLPTRGIVGSRQCE